MFTIVYGLNSPAELFLKSKHNTNNNLFACTSGDELFKGKRTLSLKEIANMPSEEVARVVVCSTFFVDICKGLDEHNVSLEKVFFFDHTRSKLFSYREIMANQAYPGEILYAVYDLSVHLACFDVFNFAVLAEVERKKLGKKHIHFLIVHARSYHQTNNTILFHEKHDHAWRIDKIVKSVFACIPSKLAVSEFPFMDDALTFLKDKHGIFPASFNTIQSHSEPINTLALKAALPEHDLSVLVAPQNAKIIVEQFLKTLPTNTKPLVITLREYGSQPKRNSDIEQWAEFLSRLDLTQYTPIIVRDTYHCAEPASPLLEKYVHFPLASLDFTLRLALYEKAYINMGVSCGPNYGISFIKGARSIIFQMTDEDNPANSTLTAKRAGLSIGEDFFFNDNKLQKTIWKKDDSEHLYNAFELLLKLINNKTYKGDDHEL